MAADHDSGGDYGYDLVHEVLTAARTPVIPAARRKPGGPGRPLDPDADYGYDQAHDV